MSEVGAQYIICHAFHHDLYARAVEKEIGKYLLSVIIHFFFSNFLKLLNLVRISGFDAPPKLKILNAFRIYLIGSEDKMAAPLQS